MRVPLEKTDIAVGRASTRLLENIDSFWVSGLALLLLFLGSKLLPFQGESYEWVQYLILGSVLPASVLAASFLNPYFDHTSALWQVIRVLLFACFILIPLPFLFSGNTSYIFLIALLQLFAMWGNYSTRSTLDTDESFSTKLFLFLTSFFVLSVAWKAASAMLWWRALDDWIITSTYSAVIFVLSVAFVSTNVHFKTADITLSRLRVLTPEHIIAVFVLAIVSFRSDYLFQVSAFHHWGVFVGPAEMVQQGGWLLWDVPSQYGFLSILTLAFFPAQNGWQSFYIVNSVLLLLSASFLFFLLRLLRPGFANYLFALSISLAGVLLLPGWHPQLIGPQGTPSIGAFRFIWCYLLLGILLWLSKAQTEELRNRILNLGCVVWLLSVFWSAEIAIYCSIIWLPAYIFLVVHKAYLEKRELKAALRSSLLKLLLPIALLIGFVVVVTVYYVIRLGSAPDWPAYFEYAFSFSGGFMTEPIDPNGPVWVIFIVFCAISTVLAYFLRNKLSHPIVGLLIGAWGALWATTSYFLPRSFPVFAVNLSPIYCTVIAIVLYVLARYQKAEVWTILIKASFVPIFAYLLIATFGYQEQISQYIFASPHIAYRKDIQLQLPQMSESLVYLLQTNNVKPDDPMFFFDANLTPVWPTNDGSGAVHLANRAWLPVHPYGLVVPLPEQRIQLYMARFSARTHASGWLIQPRATPYTTWPWFASQLNSTHTPTKHFENADWQVIWFEYKGGTP
jgi:hypothetical protein